MRGIMGEMGSKLLHFVYRIAELLFLVMCWRALLGNIGKIESMLLHFVFRIAELLFLAMC